MISMKKHYYRDSTFPSQAFSAQHSRPLRSTRLILIQFGSHRFLVHLSAWINFPIPRAFPAGFQYTSRWETPPYNFLWSSSQTFFVTNWPPAIKHIHVNMISADHRVNIKKQKCSTWITFYTVYNAKLKRTKQEKKKKSEVELNRHIRLSDNQFFNIGYI